MSISDYNPHLKKKSSKIINAQINLFPYIQKQITTKSSPQIPNEKKIAQQKTFGSNQIPNKINNGKKYFNPLFSFTAHQNTIT